MALPAWSPVKSTRLRKHSDANCRVRPTRKRESVREAFFRLTKDKMNLIKALQQCIRQKDVHLTQKACQETLDFIELSIQRQRIFTSEITALRGENCALDLQINAMKKKDTPLTTFLKWSGRWTTILVSIWTIIYMVFNWQWSPVFYVCALTNVTFYCHALWMSFEWWKK